MSTTVCPNNEIAWLIPLQAQQRLRKLLSRCFKLVRSLISTVLASRVSTYTRMVSFKGWGHPHTASIVVCLRSHTSEEAPKKKQTTNAKVAWQSLSEPTLLWLWIDKVWDMGSSNTIGLWTCLHLPKYVNIFARLRSWHGWCLYVAWRNLQTPDLYLLAVLQSISYTRVHKYSYHIIYKNKIGLTNTLEDPAMAICPNGVISASWQCWLGSSLSRHPQRATASWGVVRQPTAASSQMAASTSCVVMRGEERAVEVGESV